MTYQLNNSSKCFQTFFPVLFLKIISYPLFNIPYNFISLYYILDNFLFQFTSSCRKIEQQQKNRESLKKRTTKQRLAQFNPYQNSNVSFHGNRTNNRYRKRCSASLIIGEKHMKTTMRYHLTPVRMSVIKKIRENKYCGECGEKKTLAHYLECQFMQPVENTGDSPSKTEPPCNPVVLPLGIYPEGMKTVS